MDVATAKQALRREFLARRRAIPTAQRDAVGRAVMAHVLRISHVRAARKVALYAATWDEVPMRPIFEALSTTGCRRLLPRMTGSTLAFCCIASWEELQPGPLGVLAPPDSLSAEALNPEDVVMVPGLAFDVSGRRLGRGGGYYDRTFSTPGPLLMGTGFDLQLVERVPAESHDRAMDAIVTESGLRFWAERT